MKKFIYLLLVSLFFISCKEDQYKDLGDGIYADIKTSKGNIIVVLEYEKTPITVANFITLAQGKNPFVSQEYKEKPFYDGLKFHRVINDFMIQGGDPLGDGTGGPGYKFKDEFNPSLKHSKAGILSMANAGEKTNGSQFYITHKETPWLDFKHTVFGEVVQGMEVVNLIEMGDLIENVTILVRGSKAKKFDAVKTFKEYYSAEAEIIKVETAKFEKASETKSKEIQDLIQNGTKTSSGLIYKILSKSENKKPKQGQEVYINYAGYLENGQLFDTSYDKIAGEFGKLDGNKVAQNGYKPFAFPYGSKEGLILGFIEGIELLSIGEKGIFYLPSNLGYGSQGAGNVIPPNANIIFEIELLETMPNE